MFGGLFGCLVSDLVPKSTYVSRLQSFFELDAVVQQQSDALDCVETRILHLTTSTFMETTTNTMVFNWMTLNRVDE